MSSDSERGLAVGVEVGPVQGNGDLRPLADDEGHPMAQQGIDIDPLVGQHAVDLLDRVFGGQPPCQRQSQRWPETCRFSDLCR